MLLNDKEAESVAGDNIILPTIINKVIYSLDHAILYLSQTHSTEVLGHNEGHIVSGMRSVHLPMSTPLSAIKRSRSLGAADMATKQQGPAVEAPELGNFSLEMQDTISKAVEGV